ncbi:MAG TPA: hypothetical protein VGV41_14150 [Pseudolabrys sp.]|jgi:hypothetical protein|uniref:hypothetical protein n=1 Tax=Pseudolabrys sp. TaxID=1960880 RepID=UPI002DDD2649|nr:hypothetical protein [Pseudolabrys sp.]HEV2629774.1 hypothetical protein [Pseudolabrys sp.]
MRIYMFTSEANGLSAFSADAEGGKLPQQFAPWAPDGFVENGQQPPHNFSRFKIEAALKLVGFQLWRVKEKAE